MAAYTLPEGFTDFDMFTFGTALLVGGKWTEWRRQRACATFKGAGCSQTTPFGKRKLKASLESLSVYIDLKRVFSQGFLVVFFLRSLTPLPVKWLKWETALVNCCCSATAGEMKEDAKQEPKQCCDPLFLQEWWDSSSTPSASCPSSPWRRWGIPVTSLCSTWLWPTSVSTSTDWQPPTPATSGMTLSNFVFCFLFFVSTSRWKTLLKEKTTIKTLRHSLWLIVR